MTHKVFKFGGEESARFARFATAALAAGVGDVRVEADGREPMTSRPVFITGILKATVLDGYIRYITVLEDESGILHNIAGSNATRSIAARMVTLSLPSQGLESLRAWAGTQESFVPLLNLEGIPRAPEYGRCESALQGHDKRGVLDLISLLSSDDPGVRAEAALTLRALSHVINEEPQLREVTEKALIDFCNRERERDALVAAIEDLGYIGDDASHQFLCQQVITPRHDQACWAAVVALGRLSGGGEETLRALLQALREPNAWAQRAALLCLARRANDALQHDLEPVFARFLTAGTDDLLRRYACLGLSRFHAFAPTTWDLLVTLLSDEGAPLGAKGYGALAIAGAYHTCSADTQHRVENLLGTIARESDLESPEMDAVWSLEFLGELASISALPHLAARLYKRLARLFSDWRSHYYLAISCYELGEAEAIRSEGEDAIVRFTEALRQLNLPATGLPDTAAATIEFRRTIVTARRQLHSLFANWLDSHDSESLTNLLAVADEIHNLYNRYATPDAQIGRDRYLIQRELEYLRTTVAFITLIRHLIGLDARIRASDLSQEDLASILYSGSQIDDVISDLTTRLADLFNLPLTTLLSEVSRLLRLVLEAASAQVSVIERLKLMRGYIVQIRAVFWNSSWPLPGRACPVYGLGRATIGIRPGKYAGVGTWSDPLRLDGRGGYVLPLYVRITDMAIGGNAQLRIIYEIGETRREIPVHAVEDEYPIPIDLTDFQSLREFVLQVRAVFFSRDCSQEAAKVSLHVSMGTV